MPKKENWSLNKLISHCVKEIERFKQDWIESDHFVSTSMNKGKGLKRKKDTEVVSFCEVVGYAKKHCTNYHAWHVKKGMLQNFVCVEVTLTLYLNTWWINSGLTTHMSMSMQDFLSWQEPIDGEK